VLSALVPFLLATGLTAAGAVVGWVGDGSRLSAALLALEPALLVLGFWSAAIARWSGRQGVAFGLTFGLLGATLSARLPYPTTPPELAPPEWTGSVHRCAAALDMPSAPVRVLQWTLDGIEDDTAVVAAVRNAAPDVVVLHGVQSTALVDSLRESLGAEARVHGGPPERGATAVLATGGFHPCGDQDEWTVDDPHGLSLHFVGVPPTTVFPLVVTSFPGPFGDWEHRADTMQRTLEVLSGLQGASTVVVADARSPRASRDLGLEFGRIGLASVPVPPSWPAQLGGLPLLTLHPFTRVWLGPIWRLLRAQRVRATDGLFAPVMVELTGPPEAAAPPEPRRPLDEPTIESAPD
jgi:hypothetical protein